MKTLQFLSFLAASLIMADFACGTSSTAQDGPAGDGGGGSDSSSGSHSGGSAGKLSGASGGAAGNPATGGSGQGGDNGASGSAGSGAGSAGKSGVAAGNAGPMGGSTGAGGKAGGGSTGEGARGGASGAKIDAGAGTGGNTPGAGGKATGDASTDGNSPGTGGAATGDGRWVCTWTAAPQLVETENNPPSSPGLANNTLRQMAHVSLGGKQVRLQLSNESGNSSLGIQEAHLAVAKSPSEIDPATDKTLLFSGQKSVTIAQGKVITSDTLDFEVASLSNVAISIYFGAVPSSITGHPGARTASYIQTGNALTTANLTMSSPPEHWYFISELDVLGDSTARAIAVLGDSISDGRGSDTNKNNRWPDDLAKRLQDHPATANVAVCNQGIGGNCVQSACKGASAKDRFDRDILTPPGVEYVIIYEGVNDLSGGASAATLESVFATFVTKAHAKNMKVFGVPITPFGTYSDSSYTSKDSVRQELNTWIRDAKNFDGCLDFDKAVQDPGSPKNLLSTYSSDGLHLNAAGYQKEADSVELSLFEK